MLATVTHAVLNNCSDVNVRLWAEEATTTNLALNVQGLAYSEVWKGRGEVRGDSRRRPGRVKEWMLDQQRQVIDPQPATAALIFSFRHDAPERPMSLPASSRRSASWLGLFELDGCNHAPTSIVSRGTPTAALPLSLSPPLSLPSAVAPPITTRHWPSIAIRPPPTGVTVKSCHVMLNRTVVAPPGRSGGVLAKSTSVRSGSPGCIDRAADGGAM